MSTDEYTPSEAEMMIAWHRHATAEDAKHGRLRDDSESPTKEFVRYMARVRREAKAEALRDAKGRVYASSWWADGSDNYADRVRGFLDTLAAEYEAGDSDEHR